MRNILVTTFSVIVATAISSAPTFGQDKPASAPAPVKLQTVSANFFDPFADSLPPAKGIRPVMIWVRNSADRLLVTSKPGGDDKAEILKMIESLPAAQEAATSKFLNEIPEASSVNSIADRIRKVDGVKDVKMVVHFSKLTIEDKTPAQIDVALIVDCYEDSKDVCAENNQRVILEKNMGEYSLPPSKVADELSKLEKAIAGNVATIAATAKSNADKKKADDARRARLKQGLDKFPSGDKPTAPAGGKKN